MGSSIGEKIKGIPEKGGIIGALLGAVLSVRYHKPGEKVIKNAGKTAVFSGAGFLLGRWIEKMIKRK